MAVVPLFDEASLLMLNVYRLVVRYVIIEKRFMGVTKVAVHQQSNVVSEHLPSFELEYPLRILRYGSDAGKVVLRHGHNYDDHVIDAFHRKGRAQFAQRQLL